MRRRHRVALRFRPASGAVRPAPLALCFVLAARALLALLLVPRLPVQAEPLTLPQAGFQAGSVSDDLTLGLGSGAPATGGNGAGGKGLDLDELGRVLGLAPPAPDRARLTLELAPPPTGAELSLAPPRGVTDWGSYAPGQTSAPPGYQPAKDMSPAGGAGSEAAGEPHTVLRWGNTRVVLGGREKQSWVAAEGRFQLASSWEAEARLLSPFGNLAEQEGLRVMEGLRLEVAAHSGGLTLAASVPVKQDRSVEAALRYDWGNGTRLDAAYRIDAEGVSIRASASLGLGLSLGQDTSFSASYRLIRWGDEGSSSASRPGENSSEQEAQAALQFRF